MQQLGRDLAQVILDRQATSHGTNERDIPVLSRTLSLRDQILTALDVRALGCGVGIVGDGERLISQRRLAGEQLGEGIQVREVRGGRRCRELLDVGPWRRRSLVVRDALDSAEDDLPGSLL